MTARELRIKLGYSEWATFKGVISKAISLSVGNSEHYLRKTTKEVKIGSGAVRKVLDYELNDNDIELIRLLTGTNKPTSPYKIRNETILISLLKKYYQSRNISVIFQYRLGTYRFDCLVGDNLLFEFDEPPHAQHHNKVKDDVKSDFAISGKYQVVRATLSDDIIDIVIRINNKLNI